MGRSPLALGSPGVVSEVQGFESLKHQVQLAVGPLSLCSAGLNAILFFLNVYPKGCFLLLSR